MLVSTPGAVTMRFPPLVTVPLMDGPVVMTRVPSLESVPPLNTMLAAVTVLARKMPETVVAPAVTVLPITDPPFTSSGPRTETNGAFTLPCTSVGPANVTDV